MYQWTILWTQYWYRKPISHIDADETIDYIKLHISSLTALFIHLKRFTYSQNDSTLEQKKVMRSQWIKMKNNKWHIRVTLLFSHLGCWCSCAMCYFLSHSCSYLLLGSCFFFFINFSFFFLFCSLLICF